MGEHLNPYCATQRYVLIASWSALLFFFLRGGAGQAVERSPVCPAEASDASHGDATGSINESVEGWNHDKGQDRG